MIFRNTFIYKTIATKHLLNKKLSNDLWQHNIDEKFFDFIIVSKKLTKCFLSKIIEPSLVTQIPIYFCRQTSKFIFTQFFSIYIPIINTQSIILKYLYRKCSIYFIYICVTTFQYK